MLRELHASGCENSLCVVNDAAKKGDLGVAVFFHVLGPVTTTQHGWLTSKRRVITDSDSKLVHKEMIRQV